MVVRLTSALCVAAFLAACASQRAGDPLPPSRVTGAGRLIVHVKIPKRHARARYVSASTKALTIAIAGPTSVSTRVEGLTPSSPGCSASSGGTRCAITIPGLKPCSSNANCYAATIVTYDAYDAANNTIPSGASELSAAQSVGFAIAKGQAEAIAVTLEGIPSTVALVPDAGSALTGNQSSGFVFPKCNGSPQAVHVYGVDAGGNTILGGGAPAVTLASGNTSQLTIASPNARDPNAFALTQPAPPGYAYGNTTVPLTAVVTPGSASGASVVTAHVNVKYSGDICGIYDVFEIPTANADPLDIAAGPDEALWFTESHGNNIGRIPTTVTSSRDIKEFPIPTASSDPDGIALGPDGNLWFVETGGSSVAKIPPGATSGSQIVEFSIPVASAFPNGIAAAPGELWFTVAGANKIGRIPTSASSGSQINLFAIPTGLAKPRMIVDRVQSAFSSAMWFPEGGAGNVAYIGTQAYPPPVVSEYSEGLNSPYGIAVGPDRNLWVTDIGGNAIVRITPAGAKTPFPLAPASSPWLIAAGPDGALWFTECGTSNVGRITTDGAIAEYPVTLGSKPFAIATGPDGAIWITEVNANLIGRLR
jgi:virginiamycin B lyase